MMMKILKNSAVSELKQNISNNLDNYLSGNFDHFFADPARVIELDFEYEPSKFVDLLPGKSTSEEVHNCLLMEGVLGGITPYLARDERLWVYLTHKYLLEYSRARWELDKKSEDEIVKQIEIHFFAPDKRAVERDNSASRLWWIANLCSRVDGLSLKDVLECLLLYSDVRASIIERPTTSQCLNVFSAITKKLSFEYKSGNEEIFERKKFRELMKKINLFGGVKLLNTMKESDILAFINKEISQMST